MRDAFRAHFRDRFTRCTDLPLREFRSYLADFPRLGAAEAASCKGVVTECEVRDALKKFQSPRSYSCVVVKKCALPPQSLVDHRPAKKKRFEKRINACGGESVTLHSDLSWPRKELYRELVVGSSSDPLSERRG